MSRASTAAGAWVHVGQGTFVIADAPDAVLTTVLGSCVAACMYDSEAGQGGMNHFLLPTHTGSSADDRRYGVNAMELLINGLLQAGARRDRLRAKVFGGACMNARLTDIGAQNAAFVRRFLKTEGIAIAGESLGGASARRVHFWPYSGRARQFLVKSSDPTDFEVTHPTHSQPVACPASGVVELF